jgi:protein-disulfide isomerase
MEKRTKTLPSLPAGGIAHYVLVVLLVIAAFMLGSLFTKVQYLEKGIPQAANQGPVAAGDAAAQPQPTVGAVPKVTERDHTRGSTSPKLVMIEYSDFECPFCKSFHPTMLQVLKDYGNDIQWVYRHYPLAFHVNAQKEAEASECAYDQGGHDAFWKYTDAIYERTTSNGTGIALDSLVPLAGELGLNEATFKECLDSGKFTKYVQDDMAAAQTAGVQGTPNTIILDPKSNTQEVIPGALPYDQVKAAIDSMLK